MWIDSTKNIMKLAKAPKKTEVEPKDEPEHKQQAIGEVLREAAPAAAVGVAATPLAMLGAHGLVNSLETSNVRVPKNLAKEIGYTSFKWRPIQNPEESMVLIPSNAPTSAVGSFIGRSKLRVERPIASGKSLSTDIAAAASALERGATERGHSNIPVVYAPRTNPEFFGHEVGHLRNMPESRAGRALYDVATHAGLPALTGIGGLAMALNPDVESPTVPLAPAVAGAGQVPKLFDEGMASIRAYRALKGMSRYTPEQLAVMRGNLMKAWGTYGLGAAAAVAPIAAIAAWRRHKANQLGVPEDAIKTAAPEDAQQDPNAWQRARHWMATHPLATTGIGAGTAAAGILGHHFLTPARAASTPLQRHLRSVAQKRGLRFALPQEEEELGLIDKIKNKLLLAGHDPVWANEKNIAVEAGKGGRKLVPGVTVGLDPETRAEAELQFGGLPTQSRESRASQRAYGKLVEGDKVMEASPAVGLTEHFPRSMSMQDVLTKYRIKPLPRGANLNQKAKYLDEVQAAMKQEFADSETGYFMKPYAGVSSAGSFPSEKHSWGKLYTDYYKKLRPTMEAELQNIKTNPDEYIKGYAPENILADFYNQHPLYPGAAFESLFRNPAKTLAQRKVDLVKFPQAHKIEAAGHHILDRVTPPFGETEYANIGEAISAAEPHAAEYRVHMIGGEVPNELAFHRYNKVREIMRHLPFGKRLAASKVYGSPEEAAEWFRTEGLKQLHPRYKKGTMGIDVARVRAPGGGYTYKIMELNPSDVREGMSGFLDPTINPAAAYDVHKFIYGKPANIEAGARAAMGAGAGAVGGLGASKIMKKLDKPATPAPEPAPGMPNYTTPGL